MTMTRAYIEKAAITWAAKFNLTGFLSRLNKHIVSKHNCNIKTRMIIDKILTKYSIYGTFP